MSKERPLVYLIAGEPSGDSLGADLMVALRGETQGAIEFAGIGGPDMTGQGLQSLFSMDDLAVMGVAEVLPRLTLLLGRIRETVADARARKPDIVITIDSPDFSFRVSKRLKGNGFPLVHYVAPSVWAWRPGRATKIARFLDHVLCLLPFEPPFFTAAGLGASFVGHPVVSRGIEKGDAAGFRARHEIPEASRIVLMLPGSRHSEISRLLPVFEQTFRRLIDRFPDLVIVTPTVATVADAVRDQVASWSIPVIVVEGGTEKIDSMAAANAALAASGTVGLELAAAGCPSVIAYRVHPLTAWIAKRVIRVRYANLVNLILDREAIPERIQDNCRWESLVPALEGVLSDPGAIEAQRNAYNQALDALGRGGPPPSTLAARAILSILNSTQ